MFVFISPPHSLTNYDQIWSNCPIFVKRKMQVIENQLLANLVVPRAGIEPARTFLPKGFSCHYGFRHLFVCGPDYSFTMTDVLGVSCLVSAPSSSRRLGSRLPSALPVKASLNLRHSTSLLSEIALKSLSPSCLPFHHQGLCGCKDRYFI